MKIAFGCDHGGYVLKEAICEVIAALGHEIQDWGTHSEAAVDYPDYALPVARAVAAGEADLGILACGTGIGMSIAANKVPGAYAACVGDCYSARMARLHNAANILCLGGRVLGTELAKEIVRTFLTTAPSEEGRHQQRREKVRALEQPER